MVANILLTICTGVTCVVTESNSTHGTVQAEFSVQYLSSDLKAEHAKLSGFQTWLTTETENERLDLVSSVDESINPALAVIKQLIDEARDDGKDVDECHNEAFRNLKQAAEQKLPSMAQCINTFVESSNTNLINVPTQLAEAVTLKGTVDSIVSDCAINDDRVACINQKANDAAINAAKFESFSRQTFEKGTGDYYTERTTARTCLTPLLNELKTSANNIKSQLTTCIRNA